MSPAYAISFEARELRISVIQISLRDRARAQGRTGIGDDVVEGIGYRCFQCAGSRSQLRIRELVVLDRTLEVNAGAADVYRGHDKVGRQSALNVQRPVLLISVALFMQIASDGLSQLDAERASADVVSRQRRRV